MHRTTRRRILATGAATLALVAGCSGNGGGGNGGDGDGGDGDGGDGGDEDGGETGDTTTPPTATTTGPVVVDGDTTVEMTDELVFDPEAVSVPAGATVTWTNVGSLDHSVTAYGERIPDGAAYFASGDFESEAAARDGFPDRGAIAGGESYSHTFETAGTYDYFCIPHERAGMTGTVEVR